MVGPLGTQPNTGSVVEPQTSPLRLFAGHLQPLAPPDPLDPLVVDLPAGVAQQGGDPPIAVVAVPTGQLDHVPDQAVLIVTAARDTAPGRTVLPQHPAPKTRSRTASGSTSTGRRAPCPASRAPRSRH